MNLGSLGATLFIGLFVLIGVAILLFAMRSLTLAKQAESWPTAQGQITDRSFDVDTDEDGTSYRTKLSYAYSVGGQSYANEKIAFGYAGSSARDFHRKIYDALPVGTSLAVRYDPDNPERAVLSHGMNKSILFLLIFGAIWTVFSLGIGSLFFLMGEGSNNLLANMIIYSRPS